MEQRAMSVPLQVEGSIRIIEISDRRKTPHCPRDGCSLTEAPPIEFSRTLEVHVQNSIAFLIIFS